MEICYSVTELEYARAEIFERNPSARTGFVPTMGALHAGHTELIRRSAQECDVTIVSVYVNPKQFLPHEDFSAYPRGLERDAEIAALAGADLIFAPSDTVMYPFGFTTKIVPEGAAANELEGAFRPGFFTGVATAVGKLFQLVQPDLAFFGEKDYQQLTVIRQMTRDLNFPIEIVGVPTIRETDGLALSSRNVRLTEAERKIAPILYQTLNDAKEKLIAGASASEVCERSAAELTAKGFTSVDYLSLRDAGSFKELPCVIPGFPARLAAAAHLGTVRLIDNIPLEIVV